MPNEIVPDHYDLPLTPGMPPGRYSLQSTVRDKLFPVGVVDVTNGSAPARPGPKIEHLTQAQLGDRIRLLGYNAPSTAKPGTSLPLTLYWQAARDIPEDLTVSVQLLDAGRKLVAQNDGLTNDGFLPTTLWPADAAIPDERQLDLPGDLQPGLYHLVAGLCRFDDLARLPVMTPAGPSPDDQIELGTIKLPIHASASPKLVLNLSLGASIRLVGFDLDSQDSGGNVLSRSDAGHPSRLVMTSGQTMVLALHWQAVAPVEADYKVFVHIVDEGGSVVAQQDQMPGQNRYPTRIWDAGETVLDVYSLPLDLPPGKYNIVAGMYCPESGERLVAPTSCAALPDSAIAVGRIAILVSDLATRSLVA